jgi:hypothetical protein
MAIASKMLSSTCQLEEAGDGVVPWISAVYKSGKYAFINSTQEDLGGHRDAFVQTRKWLALTPSTNFAPDNSQAFINNSTNNELAALQEDNFGKSRNYGAMFRPASFSENVFTPNSNFGGDEPEPNFATGVKLAANGSTEIEIPVTNGSRFSLVLYASPNVSATLIDDKGEIMGKSLTGTPQANEIFRTITVKKPFQSGKWKLKLESRETSEAEVAVTAYIDYKSAVFGGSLTSKISAIKEEKGE